MDKKRLEYDAPQFELIGLCAENPVCDWSASNGHIDDNFEDLYDDQL